MEFINNIQNGTFGNNQPMYHQYNNMIPIGNTNYNYQPIYQPVYTYNPQPRYDYHNPFGAPIQPQQQFYGYNNQQYAGGVFNPYFSVQQQQKYQQEQIALEKTKFKILCSMSGREYKDDEFYKFVNPNGSIKTKTKEEIKEKNHWDDVQRIVYYSNNQHLVNSPEKVKTQQLVNYITNYHKALDSHSLCEFIEEDYPRLMREQWILDNVKINASRDLSDVYSSKDYNELLSMHKSTNNPYVSTLLDQSTYDSNVDDLEIGLAQLFDLERRKRNVLEGKLPTYISSKEVQEQRRLFTQELMDQIYQKEVKQLEQGKSN